MSSRDLRNKPTDTDFRQQRMPAWKPIITKKVFYIAFLSVGIIFLATGIPMLYGSYSVVEQSWDYTDCIDSATNKSCSSLLANFSNGYTNLTARCHCTLKVEIKGFGSSQPYLFYNLGNFYQDHRRMVISRWDPQLRSKSITGGADCDPVTRGNGLPYAPCGQIANSLFNDTIKIYQAFPSTNVAVGLSGTGISWASDREAKFKNPTTALPLCSFPQWSESAVAKPPNWHVRACELGSTLPGRYNPFSPEFNSSGLGYENEDFIVWMRVAGIFYFKTGNLIN
jgi:hypothetical protein